MKILYAVGFILFSLKQETWSDEKIEIIAESEIRTYHPEKLGVKDLVFEARIENLTEILNKTGNLGELTDVYFKIYWMIPNEYRIEVFGLPNGFEEIKKDLRELIKGKLNLIIPDKLSESLKGYTLKQEIISGKKIIKAQDLTYTKPISEYQIEFESSGALRSIKSSVGENQSMETSFQYTPKSWSRNKLVLDKVEMLSRGLGGTMSISHVLEYTNVDGVGFPKKVTVKNIANIKIVDPVRGSDGKIDPKKSKEKINKSESGSILILSNYEVNTKKAVKFITEDQKK